MSSSFGTLFRITTFGESHGPGIGVVIDGCPPGIDIDWDVVRADVRRRRPGQHAWVSQRDEPDEVVVQSGLYQGKTIGSPICLWIPSVDARSQDYDDARNLYRPSHGDFTWEAKYGVAPLPGGGRLSARETAARVAAGAIARFVLGPSLRVVAWVESIADIAWLGAPHDAAQVDVHPMRCPDVATADAMRERVAAARKAGDSVGGIVAARADGVPLGLGEPIFDKLEADLAKAMLSIPAVKGFEIGSGFAGTRMLGSQHNDPFVPGPEGTIVTTSNYSGGIQGGISNGQPITMRIAFKPTATIASSQATVDRQGNPATLAARGRHDPCVVPRAVPIVEAMTRIVLADHLLRQRALQTSS